MNDLFDYDYINEKENISYEKKFLEYCKKKKKTSKRFAITGFIISALCIFGLFSTDPFVLGILIVITLFVFLVFLVSLCMFINFGLIFIVTSLGQSGVEKSKLKSVIISRNISVVYLLVFVFVSIMSVIGTVLNSGSLLSLLYLIVAFSCSELFAVKYIKLADEYIANKKDELLKIEERNSFYEMFK